MAIIEQFLLAVHIASGSLALVAGAIALLTVKGGRMHRRSGRYFWRLIGVVLLTAAALLPFRVNAFLASLTVFSAYLAFSGVRVLARRRGVPPTVLDWSLAASAIVVGGALGVGAVVHPPAQGVMVVVAVLGGVVMYGAYDVASIAWRFHTRWRNLWLYEHIFKILGAYTAVVAAFSGSVLRLFAPPWQQLWPSLVSTPLAVGLVLHYRRKLKGGSELPGQEWPPPNKALYPTADLPSIK